MERFDRQLSRGLVRGGFILALVVTTFVAVTALAAPVSAVSDHSLVFPPSSHPYGSSYGQWAAEWHKWLHRIPVPVNPMLDTTGENCAQGQSGQVWFLMGIPAERDENGNITGPGSRTCTVPKGKAILAPVQNSFWWNWTTDPPPPHSPEFQAQIREMLAGGREDHGLDASVDGVEVTDLTSYGHESPMFFSVVPDDNIIDYFATLWGGVSNWLEGDNSGPHYDAGVYLIVKPLPVGEHEISISGWDGNWAGTWHITVE